MQMLSWPKRILVIFLGFVATVAVSATVLAAVLLFSVLNKDFMVETLSGNNGYELFVGSIGEAFIQQSNEEGLSVDADQEDEYTEVIRQYIDAEKYQSVSSVVVASVYDWLHGDAEHINFEANLFDSNAEMRSFFVDIALLRVNSLPNCASVAESIRAAENPLDAECKPLNISQQELESQVNNLSDEQLDEVAEFTTISSDDMNMDQFEEDAANARTVVQEIKKAPLMGILLTTLLFAVAVMLLNTNRSRMVFVGSRLVAATLALLALALVFAFANLDVQIAESIARGGENISQESLAGLLKPINDRILAGILLFAGLPFVTGVALWVSSGFVKKGV